MEDWSGKNIAIEKTQDFSWYAGAINEIMDHQKKQRNPIGWKTYKTWGLQID